MVLKLTYLEDFSILTGRRREKIGIPVSGKIDHSTYLEYFIIQVR